MNINAIQINESPIYRARLLLEPRIIALISELNVHFGKINYYREEQLTEDKINLEVIDSLTILEEINRLVPQQIEAIPGSGDFKLGVDLLESIIALLNTQSGYEGTRTKLLSLGLNLNQRLYRFSYESLVHEAFIFNWLKLNKLVQSPKIPRNRYQSAERVGKIIKFSPSKEDIDNFYNANKSEIYQYMVRHMGPDKTTEDPFGQAGAADFYHYHQTLLNISVQPESAA